MVNPVREARCITCDAPIEWAQTFHASKWIPLDPGVVEDGNLEVVRVVGDGTPIVRLVPIVARVERDDLRRTHFATCVDAGVHRRRR